MFWKHVCYPEWRCGGKRPDEPLISYRFIQWYLRQIPIDVPPMPITLETSKKFFSMWLQGEEHAPNVVKACWRSVNKHHSGQLVIIDEEHISDWITLPDYIIEKRKKGLIGDAHFSDICRVELLWQYGGVWLDSTDFLPHRISEEVTERDIFMYMAGKNIYPHTFVQNCFIVSKKGHPLLGAWRNAIYSYWKHNKRALDYFIHQFIFKHVVTNSEEAKFYFEQMPHVDQDATHVLWKYYKDKPFDAYKFEQLTSEAAFQKTEYKSQCANTPVPGTFAHHVVYGK